MKALLATKLKNQLLAVEPALTVQLKNVRINGEAFGCSGFITDPATGTVVYLNTDHNHGTNYDRAYFRTARDTRDYTGGLNHFADYESLAEDAVRLAKAAQTI
jgi:hypothetical protein